VRCGRRPSAFLATVTLDERGEVVSVGPHAEALLDNARKLRVVDRRLRSENTRVERWLRAVEVGRRHGSCWLARDARNVLRLHASPRPDPTTHQPHRPWGILFESHELVDGLSAALYEVGELIAEGHSDKDIARPDQTFAAASCSSSA